VRQRVSSDSWSLPGPGVEPISGDPEPDAGGTHCDDLGRGVHSRLAGHTVARWTNGGERQPGGVSVFLRIDVYLPN
jgi:hypothetical protein